MCASSIVIHWDCIPAESAMTRRAANAGRWRNVLGARYAMSDKPDIEAIRKRNEERKGDFPYGWAEELSESQAVADIDALLAEVERLQDPILCMCGMPADVHFKDDGLWATWWPEPPHRTTAHSMVLTHRAPADVFMQCKHGRSLHPQSDDCWSGYVIGAMENVHE